MSAERAGVPRGVKCPGAPAPAPTVRAVARGYSYLLENHLDELDDVLGALRDRIEGRKSRGASTLSMQLAGFLSPDLARPGARSGQRDVRHARGLGVLLVCDRGAMGVDQRIR